ncbi:SusD family protein [Sphingobacterium nematocida]|uniref:SusD family protein n=1 Tax=Sphingobacterium nematocida TaxID=1513896 RepID=A0A1T5D8R4_9SPHI|nr:RagB/SusD family nutrient uptake outer membrane protein [Sphingobacterium nematocida]SKB68016.1 SusD family protein [Sphingobacterium nematocida]
MKSRKIKIYRLILLVSSLVTFSACSEFLDIKPDATLAVPERLEDLEGLVDGFTVMNTTLPSTSAIYSDDYYVLSADWTAQNNVQERNFYLWQSEGEFKTIISREFRAILYTNMVLDRLKSISASTTMERDTWNRLRGSALFHRGLRYYVLALHHAPHPNHHLADQTKVPLRLTSDNSSKSKLVPTSSIYEQILTDLREAVPYLPDLPLLPSRPSRAAAYGLLAKVLLDLGRYESALQYADSCLMIKRDLVDLNTINVNAAAPFQRFNKEVIFHARSGTASIMSRNVARVNEELFDSYSLNDLRRKAFFVQNLNGKVEFKGDYDGRGTASGFDFWGIIVPDILLVKSECLSRLARPDEAKAVLWELLKNRLTAGEDNPYKDELDMLTAVLNERRKELIRKGARWIDIRRLMFDEVHKVSLKREINGKEYQPNEDRLYINIPNSVLAYGE